MDENIIHYRILLWKSQKDLVVVMTKLQGRSKTPVWRLFKRRLIWILFQNKMVKQFLSIKYAIECNLFIFFKFFLFHKNFQFHVERCSYCSKRKKKKRKQQQQQILKKSAGYICKFPQTSKKSNCIYWQTWRCSCLRKYRVKVTDWYKFISATYLLIKTSKLTMRYGNQAMQISHVINPLLCNAVKWSETLYDIAK